jgi:hypothetical protein
MANAIKLLLNDAVNLYVQAVDYLRILKSQIPAPIDVRIWKIMPESLTSGYCCQISTVLCQILARLAGILDGSDRSSRIQSFWLGSSQNNRITASWPGSSKDRWLPVNWPGSSRLVLDSDYLYVPNIKKYFYIILY